MKERLDWPKFLAMAIFHLHREILWYNGGETAFVFRLPSGLCGRSGQLTSLICADPIPDQHIPKEEGNEL